MRAGSRHLLHRIAYRGDGAFAFARADHELSAVTPLAAEQRRRAECGHTRGLDQVTDRLGRGLVGPGLGRGADDPDEVAVGG